MTEDGIVGIVKECEAQEDSTCGHADSEVAGAHEACAEANAEAIGDPAHDDVGYEPAIVHEAHGQSEVFSDDLDWHRRQLREALDSEPVDHHTCGESEVSDVDADAEPAVARDIGGHSEVDSVGVDIANDVVAHKVLAPEEKICVPPCALSDDMAPVLSRDSLIKEVSSEKAKFNLTLQSLRSIMVLEADMGWADILEHIEELAAKAQVGALIRDGVVVDEEELRSEELRQAEQEVQDLEAKVDEQAAFIARLRELLQKQQGLLDLTTDQFEKQHERNEQHQLTISNLEAMDAFHQETMANHDYRINDLSMQCEGLQIALEDSRALVVRQDAELKAKTARIAELQAEIVAGAEQAQLGLDQQRAEAQAESERYHEDIHYLEDLLNKQAEVAERMTEQLQVYEAAERRRYSYRPQARGSRDNMGEEDSVAFSAENSVGSARPSARGARPPPDVGEQDSVASTSSTPLPSSRSYWGQSSVGSMPMPSSPASARAPLASMTGEERIRFLAHFPMASRTERHLRNVIEDRKKLRP